MYLHFHHKYLRTNVRLIFFFFLWDEAVSSRGLACSLFTESRAYSSIYTFKLRGVAVFIPSVAHLREFGCDVFDTMPFCPSKCWGVKIYDVDYVHGEEFVYATLKICQIRNTRPL